jgi:3-oxoacyl-[acyl-carrier-protein] synthase-3
MTGIRERRFFPPGTRPSSVSIESARRAIASSEIDPHQFGALVHGSVCRDFLEPATACRVHHGAGLPPEAIIYDVSNACLGILNGIVQVANMIELGQIRAGVVAGTECGRSLVENTIAHLNSDHALTRESVKDSIASLTIGSASAAIVLCDEELSQTGNRLTAATVYCDTDHHELCQSRGLETFMDTDSEELMRRGVAAGAATFKRFLGAAGWQQENIDRTFCHQVGVAHRKLMFESLGLDPAIDFATVATLGNTGAVALPVTMAIGVEQGRLRPQDRVAMLGIGSGINCLMLAVEWKNNPAGAAKESAKIASLAHASG